ncbi:S-adenosyl-L-methionine-dependent methyltransferase [Gymnopus androsaceus JB14]|uniref:S-adenosyl-L-methionine-dependent methyltransferase n=1 Tax=Gymnopus androsaceus JB14 TaxID=1447944 RepID=A0A6A4HAV6_9AGAR|nr:S-adenosyl-L-methionine-dependent methyltransferase [Gymnopus androsaceus JB14]
MSESDVQLLLDTITQAVTSLNLACSTSGASIPDIRKPFEASSENFRTSSFEALQAARVISAAALQLEAIVAPPEVVLYHVVGGFFKSMALRVCLESNVTEILRDAGQKGMHVQDIAKANGQDPQKLARFLRYLCSNHVYREVSPDVFANNRISSLLDTKKTIDELRRLTSIKTRMDWLRWLDITWTNASKVQHTAWEALNDPAMTSAKEHIGTPLNKAYNLPDTPPDATLNAFEWGKLPKGSKIVDIGGGIGNVFFPVAEQFPELNIVIQDLPGVVGNAKKVWADRMPDALKTGRVKPEAHNFFDAQPHKDASVFFIKHVLHNWSDSSCLKILKRLRDASDSQTSTTTIPGSIAEEAPRPLLANFGALNEAAYVLDMVMFVILDAQERTYNHLNHLLVESGWTVVSVKRKPGDAAFVQIEAKPEKSSSGIHAKL